MPDPTRSQMEALEEELSRYKPLRNALDEIRINDITPIDPDSDDWTEYESPRVVSIMALCARAVLWA